MFTYSQQTPSTVTVNDMVFTYSDVMGALEAARQMCVRYAVDMADAHRRNDTAALWSRAAYLNAAEREYSALWSIAWWSGWTFRNETERPSYHGKPWVPLITASVHFSLEEARAERRADRKFHAMCKAWREHLGNVSILD